MKLLEQILAADDTATEIVDCPEWKVKIKVRTLTGAEKDAWETQILAAKKKGGINLAGLRTLLIVKSACDDQGKPSFSTSDVPKLNQKSALVLNRIYEVAAKLSGISEQDEDDMLELEGN